MTEWLNVVFIASLFGVGALAQAHVAIAKHQGEKWTMSVFSMFFFVLGVYLLRNLGR